MVWLEIAASAAAREHKDGWRDRVPALDPERDWKSDRSGRLSMGGRNVVERDPDTAELVCVLVLTIDRIVRIEPVGDCVSERAQMALTQRTRSLADSAPNHSTPSP